MDGLRILADYFTQGSESPWQFLGPCLYDCALFVPDRNCGHHERNADCIFFLGWRRLGFLLYAGPPNAAIPIGEIDTGTDCLVSGATRGSRVLLFLGE
jgi:hypothetical protein